MKIFFLFLFSLAGCIGNLEGVEGYRAAILHFLDDPAYGTGSYEYYEDGVLLVDNGKVVKLGPAMSVLDELEEGVTVHEYPHSLIVPGFIDTHIHYPQTDMIASYGEQLLEWLDKYTFPHEKRFWDKAYADKIANKFFEELLRNGTTSALIFASSSRASAEAIFEAAEERGMRVISGVSLGDRNLPDYLLKQNGPAYEEAKELIAKWHGRGRLRYAVTPRFAPTSTEQQLEMVQRLLEEHPDLHLHTHLSENANEVAWVEALFPWSEDYLDVYDRYGFLRARSLFAHSIHLSDREIRKLSESGSAVSFCPTSNLFLGSGLFKWRTCREQGLLIGLGTDVGAGTSFSLLKTMGEGYKVAQLQNDKMNPFEAFYLATLGGARALDMDAYVGNFEEGKEADFVVLDLEATPLMTFRMGHSKELLDRLFLLMILGDERNISETFIMGKSAFGR